MERDRINSLSSWGSGTTEESLSLLPNIYMKNGYVYIMASKKNGVLYIGVTSNLRQRIRQHKNELIDGFTKKYFVKKLVYYEEYWSISDAIRREKELKWYLRSKKMALIVAKNPDWKDLFDEI